MRLSAVLLASALAFLSAAPATATAIGVAAPLTGDLGLLGGEMRDGATAAVAAINAAGGVLGQPLTLSVVDDGCAARKADTVANQLAAAGAAMVIGHLCLEATLAGAAVYAADRIVEIAPATTLDRLTDNPAGPGLFRLAGRDRAEGAAAGVVIARDFAGRKVAVVDDGTAYGRALADGAVAAMAAAGMPPATRAAFDSGRRDYSALVSQVKAAAPDALLIAGAARDAAVIVRAIRDQGMTTQFFGGELLLDADYGKRAGDAAEGTRVVCPADPRKFPEAAAAVAALTAAGTGVAGYTLPAYAAVQVWAAAAQEAGTVDFARVVQTMHAGTFSTVIGPVSFDEKGDLAAPRYDWFVWHAGDYREQGM